MSNLISLTTKLAARFDMEGQGVMETLKATAFKGQVSDAQMTALLIVANQYGLNPWTKEIYAFPDKNNGIVPVVGVDGWSRIINDHAQFDGMEFELNDESCTCRIYRKDRSRAISVTEYMSECKRPNVGPWTSHPKRMLRHKAMIQCARLAFGFTGIHDQDEAERIADSEATRPLKQMGEAEVIKHANERYPDEKLKANSAGWIQAFSSGTSNADHLIKTIGSKYELSKEQEASIRELEKNAKKNVATDSDVIDHETGEVMEQQ